MKTDHAEVRLDLLSFPFSVCSLLGAPSPAELLSRSCVCSCINSGQVDPPPLLYSSCAWVMFLSIRNKESQLIWTHNLILLSLTVEMVFV